MTLLAAFQVRLYRYTDQDDILVGSPAAARSRAAFSNVVGYFVNPLVLRADLSGNPTFAQFLVTNLVDTNALNNSGFGTGPDLKLVTSIFYSKHVVGNDLFRL